MGANAGEDGAARRAALAAGAAGLLALGGLAALLGAAPGSGGPAWMDGLPAFDAAMNFSSALLAVAGFLAVRAGRTGLHRGLMLAALACSALFLAGYIAYHRYHGETHYLGQGAWRTVYFTLLIVHVALSAVVLPLLLTTVAFAGLGFFARHRRLARVALPLWLTVSVTGVLVYLFLRSSYP